MSLPPTVFVDHPSTVNYGDMFLPMWTLYDHPRDFPHAFVVRLFEGQTGQAMPTAIAFASLDEVRRAFAGGRWHFLARNREDDPAIVGTYL